MNRIYDGMVIAFILLALILLVAAGIMGYHKDKENNKPINVVIVGDSNVCGRTFIIKLVLTVTNDNLCFEMKGKVGSKIQDVYVPKNNVGYIFITTGINDNPNKDNKQLVRLELLNMINNICMNNPKSTVIYVLQHKPSDKYFEQWSTLFDIWNEIFTDFKYFDLVFPSNFKFNYGLGILTEYEESKILEADGLHLNGKGQIEFANLILNDIDRDVK